MIVIFGLSQDDMDLGVQTRLPCSTCGDERPFRLHLHYVYWHVYRMFGKVRRRWYTLHCDVCSETAHPDPEDVRRILTADPVPVFHRYGCLWLVLGALLFLALAAIGAAFEGKP